MVLICAVLNTNVACNGCTGNIVVIVMLCGCYWLLSNSISTVCLEVVHKQMSINNFMYNNPLKL